MAEALLRLARAAPVPGFERPDCALRIECDLGVAKLQVYGTEADEAFARIVGAAPPPPCRQVQMDDVAVAWLAPGEWLLTGSEDALCEALAKAATDDSVVLAVDITHGRAAYLLGGGGARDALAAHCPLDLGARAFGIGDVARTLLGDVGLFVARLPDAAGAPRFRLMVDQSMAAYAVRMLAGPCDPGKGRG